MAAQHVIELNGKRYDTVTGKVIVDKVVATSANKPKLQHATDISAQPRAAQPHKAPRNIDGFTRAKTAIPSRTAAAPNHTKRHPEKSQTLMRSPAKAQTIRSISTDVAPVTGFITPTQAPRIIFDPGRLKRAQAIPQNKFIGRFVAASTPPAIIVEPSELELEPPAAVVVEPKQQEQPNQFAQAIAHAKSHEQHKLSRPRAYNKVARKLHVKPRSVGIASILVSVGIVASLVTYQNIPKMRMQVASNRSGVAGVLPGYVPSGYSLGKKIGYKPGEITLSFYSNSDARNFVVTQDKSYWTSDLLRTNYVEKLNVDYQTIQQNGKTIYLYGNSATWVDGGTWYRIESKDGSLSSSQISNLVKSL